MKLADYRKIAPALNEALRVLFEKHGLKMGKLSAGVEERTGTIRYSITASDANLKDASGAATTPEAERYKQNCRYLDLKAEWLGKTFKLGSEQYELLGLLDKRSDKRVLVRRVSDGSNRIATIAMVRDAFAFAELKAAS